MAKNNLTGIEQKNVEYIHFQENFSETYHLHFAAEQPVPISSSSLTWNNSPLTITLIEVRGNKKRFDVYHFSGAGQCMAHATEETERGKPILGTPYQGQDISQLQIYGELIAKRLSQDDLSSVPRLKEHKTIRAMKDNQLEELIQVNN